MRVTQLVLALGSVLGAQTVTPLFPLPSTQSGNTCVFQFKEGGSLELQNFDFKTPWIGTWSVEFDAVSKGPRNLLGVTLQFFYFDKDGRPLSDLNATPSFTIRRVSNHLPDHHRITIAEGLRGKDPGKVKGIRVVLTSATGEPTASEQIDQYRKDREREEEVERQRRERIKADAEAEIALVNQRASEAFARARAAEAEMRSQTPSVGKGGQRRQIVGDDGLFRKDFLLDTIPGIAGQIAKIPKKSEFESEAVYSGRLRKAIGRMVSFSLPLKLNDEWLKYDPENGEFLIEIPLTEFRTTGKASTVGTYTGSNAFNVKKEIYRQVSQDSRLELVRPGEGSLEHSTSTSLVPVWDGVAHQKAIADCVVHLKCPPEEAKRKKDSFLLIYSGQAVNGGSEISRTTPTISSPFDTRTTTHFVELDRGTASIYLVDLSSRKVLREVRFIPFRELRAAQAPSRD